MNNVNLFDLLQNDISDFSELGSVFVAGDFNARVGLKHDFIVCDAFNEFTDDTEYSPDVFSYRASHDNMCNNFGTHLLDLCKATCVRIINGRIGSDAGKGAFTYVSAQGRRNRFLVHCEF